MGPAMEEPEEMEAEPAAAAAAADGAEENNNNNSAEAEEERIIELELIDVINESLTSLLAKAQEKADAANELVTKKREELEKAEAEVEEMTEKMELLREKGQALADDEQWSSMYERLRVWSKEQGHCNPRRNWKSKIDAEEKALGNWSGKQRREEKQNQLNPFKKAALQRIGFAFDAKQQKWEEFHEEVKAYLDKYGKIPENFYGQHFLANGGKELQRRLVYYQSQPKAALGEYKDTRAKDKETGEYEKKEIVNYKFTQDRIDFLSEAGLDWKLSFDQVERLKEEKGLIFPMPKNVPRPEDGDIVALEKHSWLTMYEALVGFKEEHGHTFVTAHSTSEEMYNWVCQQRKKMQKFDKNPGSMTKEFNEYQAEMLSGIDFVYSKPDTDWMEQYERLVAFKRLFGCVAVTDKFCSFEVLQQWVDDNKRLCLGIPQLALNASVAWARSSGIITIPLAERQNLLDDLSVFDVEIGEEEIAARKSHYFFRTAEQVKSWDSGVLGSIREKRNAAIATMNNMSTQQHQGSTPTEKSDDSAAASSLHERCRQAALSENDCSSNIWHFDSKKEKDFFLKKGAVVSATIAERNRLAASVANKFYGDGRPTTLCRISHCYNTHGSTKKQFLCYVHFNMIESAAKWDPSAWSEEAKSGEGEATTPTEQETVFSCTYCEKTFDAYEKAACHEKDCGSVREATKIPVPQNQPSRPAWTKVPMAHHLRGEAKVLAENYRYMVWKVATEYRKKLSTPQKANNNECVSAALGEKRPLTLEDNFILPAVKFPSKYDEMESIKLFRRCGGPLAATVLGREKLVEEKQPRYGDGRPLRFCRVAGCQMEHSESESKRYLCNCHHVMIERESESTTSKLPGAGGAGSNKRKHTYSKMSEVRDHSKARKDTFKVGESAAAKNDAAAAKNAAAVAKAIASKKAAGTLKARESAAAKNAADAAKNAAAVAKMSEVRAYSKARADILKARESAAAESAAAKNADAVLKAIASKKAADTLKARETTAAKNDDATAAKNAAAVAKAIASKRVALQSAKATTSKARPRRSVRAPANMRKMPPIANYGAPFIPRPYGWPPPMPHAMLPPAMAAFAAGPVMMHGRHGYPFLGSSHFRHPNAKFPPTFAPPNRPPAVATTIRILEPAPNVTRLRAKEPSKIEGKTSTIVTDSSKTKPATTADAAMKLSAESQGSSAASVAKSSATTDAENESVTLQKDLSESKDAYLKSAMAVEAALEPADADISQFMGC